MTLKRNRNRRITISFTALDEEHKKKIDQILKELNLLNALDLPESKKEEPFLLAFIKSIKSLRKMEYINKKGE